MVGDTAHPQVSNTVIYGEPKCYAVAQCGTPDLKAPSANKQQISLVIPQNPLHLFTYFCDLNRVCVTVAKRVEILKVNTSESILFFTDLKNIQNS